MSNDRIRRLYESRLLTWAQSRSVPVPVRVQNQTFTPPANEDPLENLYLEIFVLPAAEGTNLSGDTTTYRGVVQVNMVGPKGKGVGIFADIKAELMGLLPVNLELTDDDFVVQSITPLSEGPGLPGDTTYTIPMSLSYRTDTTH